MLREIYKENEDVVLLTKAIPVKELVNIRVKREAFESKEEYEKAVKIYTKKCYNEIAHNKLSSIRQDKKERIRSRLLAGESLEEIVADRKLNVCKGAVEKIQEELENLNLLEKAMPVRKLAYMRVKRENFESEEEYKNAVKSYAKKCQDMKYNNKLTDIIQYKKREIRSRLLEGEGLEEIIADRELNVCKEAVENEQMEIERERKRAEMKKKKAEKAQLANSKKTKRKTNGVKHTNRKETAKANGKEDVLHIIKQMQQNYRKLCNKKKVDTEERKQTKEVESIDRKIEKLENLQCLSKSQQRELATLVEEKSSIVNDIEELKKLISKLNFKMRKECYYAGIVYEKIIIKMRQIEQNNNKQVTKDISKDSSSTQYNSSPIDTICSQVSEGTLDIEIAEKIIELEAKNQVQNGSKSKFALTEEDTKRKIVLQIRQALVKNASKYVIKNSQNAISSLLQITGEDEKIIFEVIVNNLIENEQFDSAKEICCYYSQIASKQRDDMLFKETNALARKIRNYELGNIILRALQLDTELKNNKFWESVIDGIERGKVKLEAVPLGKSDDGTRKLTLGDIWPNNKNRTH